MGVAIPDAVQDALKAARFWHLVTLGPDGAPQSTPVWAHTDGAHVIVNTAKGRAKDRNMRADARVALSSVDFENPYSSIEIRGTIAEIVEGQPAEDGIDDLCEKYTGQRPYPWRAPGEQRVIFKVDPTYVSGGM